MFPLPCRECLVQLRFALLNGSGFSPFRDCVLLQNNEDTLSAVLYGWQPRNVCGEFSAPDTEIEFAIDIRDGGFKPCESYLSDDFAHTMNEDDPLHLPH